MYSVFFIVESLGFVDVGVRIFIDVFATISAGLCAVDSCMCATFRALDCSRSLPCVYNFGMYPQISSGISVGTGKGYPFCKGL